MPDGLYLCVTHTGSIPQTLLLSDIEDAIDFTRSYRKAGPLYISPGQTNQLLYTKSVQISYEIGAVRNFMNLGYLTAIFCIGDALKDAIQKIITGGGIPYRNEVHVDPNGNDANPGTNIQPVLTVQAALDISSPEDCIVIHPGDYNESLIWPDNRYCFGMPGARIIGPSGTTAVTIVNDPLGGAVADLNTMFTGVEIVGQGIGGLGLRVTTTAPGVREPTVPFIRGNVNAINGADNILVDGGTLLLREYSEVGGDGTQGTAIQASPLPGASSIVMANDAIINIVGTGFDIDDEATVILDGTHLDVDTITATVVDLNAPTYGLFQMKNPNLNSFNNAGVLLQQAGSGARSSINVALNDILGNISGDLFAIDGGRLEIEGGKFSSTGGKGLILSDGTAVIRNSVIESPDLAIDQSGGTLESYDTRWKDPEIAAATTSRGIITGGIATIDGGYVGGVHTNGENALEIDGATVNLTGGVDLESLTANALQLDSGTLNRGYANLLAGNFVINGGTENTLRDQFGKLRVGPQNAQAEITAVTSLPLNNQGFNKGSMVFWVTDPIQGPRIHTNQGTDAVVSWKPVQKMFEVAGNPNTLATQGYFGDRARDTVSGKNYTQITSPSGTTWELISSVAGPSSSDVYDIVRFGDTAGSALQSTGIRMYPAGGSDPVPGGGVPVPDDGDLYYNTTLKMMMSYDGLRSKWLSIEAQEFSFGRNGNTAPNQYYRTVNGRIMSSALGWRAVRDGTVVSISYTRTDIDTATFDVVSGGVSIGTLVSSATNGDDKNFDADFSSNSILAVRNVGVNPTSDVVGWIRVKWRA